MTHFGYFTVDLFDCPPFKMFSNGDDPRAMNILTHRRFEPYSMKLWCHFARTATCILDIGAHTGIYALAAASLRKDVPIHAFEPNPYAAARLRVNKHANGFDNIADHLVALTEANGITEIAWTTKPGGWLSSGSNIGKSNRGMQGCPVYAATLDSLDLQAGPSPLVKIDVEGHEASVVAGMTAFLKSRPIIILESFIQTACTMIASAVDGYRFFAIHEDGHLREEQGLMASRMGSGNLNHLLLPKEMQVP